MIDCLTLLLEDVARLEPVVGKNQYLPLTRRIHRGLALRDVRGADDEQTLARIVGLWRNNVVRVVSDQVNFQSNKLDLYALAQDVETFLNDGSFAAPATLQAWLDSMQRMGTPVAEDVQTAGWKYFDLFSLLPMDARADLIREKNLETPVSHFRSIEDEHQESRRRLVEGTLRFVLRICSHFTGQGVPYLDLVQEGCKGLLRATEMFDERAGSRFETYSSTWIMQAVSRYIADSASLIRIPVHAVEQVKTMVPAYEELANRLGREPSDDEFAISVGALTLEEIDSIRHEVKRRSVIRKVDTPECVNNNETLR